jgi:hypothetical protein
MALEAYEIVLMLVGVAFALMGTSILFFGYNIAFLFIEHFIIGGAGGVALIGYWRSLDKSAFQYIAAGRTLLIVPLLIGLLVFTRWTKYRWAARYPTSMMIGIGVGLIAGLVIDSQIINMATMTITNLTTLSPDPISAILMVVGVVTVLTYFLYSRTYSYEFHQGRLSMVARIGRIFLMCAAGFLWCRIFINEAIDPLVSRNIVWFRRTVRDLTEFMAQ